MLSFSCWDVQGLKSMTYPPYPTKLNIGCGYDKRVGYLNVDVDPRCEPDLLIVNDDYSIIPISHFEEVIAFDVVEHIPRNNCNRAVLDWNRYLVPEGRLLVQTSSILGVAEQLMKTPTFESQFNWSSCLFGNQQHFGDFHHNGFTEKTLRVLLMACGFQITKFELRQEWLFYAEAIKTLDWARSVANASDLSDESFIDAAYHAALFRPCDENGRVFFMAQLSSGSYSRVDVLRTLYAAPERMFRVAQAAGL
jgi:hypothetical protein